MTWGGSLWKVFFLGEKRIKEKGKKAPFGDWVGKEKEAKGGELKVLQDKLETSSSKLEDAQILSLQHNH